MRTQLYPGEHLMYITNKHWLALAKPTVLLAAAVFLTVSLYYYKATVASKAVSSLFGQAAQLGIAATIGLVLYLAYSIYERRFNIWAVTNRRIIDEWGVFSRNVKENALDKIHNVSVRQPLVGMMLNFGDVEVQTAAEQGATIFTLVSSPKKLHEAVVASQEALRVSSQKESHGGDTETKDCPFCAERIKAMAKVCRYCGQSLDSAGGAALNNQGKETVKYQARSVSAVPTGFSKLS